MNESTLEKMKQMKFYGMYNAFTTVLQTHQTDPFTPDQLISHLIDHEYDDRQSRKVNRLVSLARFRYQASIELLRFDPSRNLDKNLIHRLSECEFILRGENLLITGSTGVGKSYLASALGHHACNLGYKVSYYNTAKLLAKLKMARADGTYIREIAKIEKQNLLVLDDWGLQTMDKDARSILMDIVEDRHGRGSMVITSQIPVSAWYEIISEKTYADAIMDRIVHNAHRIELQGDSLRRKKMENNGELLIERNN